MRKRRGLKRAAPARTMGGAEFSVFSPRDATLRADSHPLHRPEKRSRRHARVAFVALSGVRVVDPELRALGLSLPGFVDRGRAIAELPSLGLLTLAAYAPEGWELSYREVDEDALEDVVEALLREGREIVAISALSARIADAYRLADALRARGVHVVLGGLHVSAMLREASAHADTLILGEGEHGFERFCEDWMLGRPAACYVTRYVADRAPPGHVLVGEVDFGATRVPRFDLLDASRYDRVSIQASRGCPLDCVFCAASRTIAPYRKKSLSAIRDELEALCAIWPRPFVELADDNSFVDSAWGRGLVELLGDFAKRRGLRWFTESDVRVADNPELLATMAASACVQVLIGLESPRAAALRGVDARDWKAGRVAELRDRIERIHSYGIAVNACFVFGFDADDRSCFEETLVFIDELDLAEVQITVLTPFPGTELYAKLQREERLLAPDDRSRCTLFDVNYEPAEMTARELADGFRALMAELYSEERVARRRRRRRDLRRRALEVSGVGEEGGRP